MDRIKTTKTTKTTIFAALVIALLGAPTASAQATAATIAIVSGNGQMPCPTCPGKNFRNFSPLVVKVTDAAGKAIAGKTVNWQVTGFSAGSAGNVANPTSITDNNGIAAMQFFQSLQSGSGITPFVQTTVFASADSVSAQFIVTQALTDSQANSALLVFDRLDSPPDRQIGGPAGSTGTVPIRVHVDARGIPIPNVSIRLLNPDPKTLPSAACATQQGADPFSVLTDVNGDAVCNPVFGPVAGSGSFNVLVGGLDPLQFDQTESPQPLASAVAYDEFDFVTVNVTPVTAGLLQVSSGNNQSVNPGQTSSPLVVLVTDSTGVVPVGNEKVTWTLTPATGAFLTSTNTVSLPTTGLSQTSLTLAANAFGQYTVKAALTSNSNISATFTITTNIQISSLAKVSGDLQSVGANQTFAAPLVVQVNATNGQPLANTGVNFAISGPGTLGSNSAFTDATGRAQATVRAGATAGAVTVTASVGNISQSFTLTVLPPGPSLSTGTFVNGASLTQGLSPCTLATVTATGLAPGVQGLMLQSNGFGPWPTSLAGETVTVNNVAAPVISLGTVSNVEQLSFQVPCEAPVGSVPVRITVSGGSATSNITLTAASPGIFETVMSDGVRRGVVVRPDGTFVSLQNPARRGEIVRVFATGLGPTIPAVVTGALPVPGSDALVSGAVIVGVNNAGTRVVTSRLSPNLIGVYEVAFQVPSDAPAGNDIVLSVAVNALSEPQTTRFSNGSKIPIQ